VSAHLAAAAALLLMTSVVGTAGASPTTTAPETAAPPQNCVATYTPKEKVPGEPTELVLTSYGCGDVTAAGKTAVKAWADADYKGDTVTLDLNDWNGTCDIDGYRWDTLPPGWDNRISSFRAYDTCQGVRLYEDTRTSGKCGSWEGDVTYVGDEMNDKASSARAADRKKNC
jgi:hypothetical protein